MALDLIEFEAGVDAASFAITTPSSWASGDLLHLPVATWGGNTSPSSAPSGSWGTVGYAEGPANPAASDESTLTVFDHEYTGSSPGLTIPDSGSYQNAALLVYRDVHADIWDVSPSFGTITNQSSITITGISTNTNDALVVVYISLGNDRTVTACDIANATAITLGGSAPTEHLITQNVSTAGNDSNCIVMVGRMTTAGASGDVTLTLSAAASGGYMIGALKPTGGGPTDHPGTVNSNWGSMAATAAATVDHPATVSTSWGSMAATSTATVDHSATVSTGWGAMSATASATVDHPATVNTSWGGWTATADGTVTPGGGDPVDHPGTISSNWGALTATATGTVDHPATVNSGWGALAATASATVDHPATVTTNWGALAATSTATITHPATINTTWGGWTATAIVPAEFGPPSHMYVYRIRPDRRTVAIDGDRTYSIRADRRTLTIRGTA